MRYFPFFLFLVFACTQNPTPSTDQSTPESTIPEFAMVIHGGAGAIKKENMTPELELAYITALKNVLEHGRKLLQGGGSSLDAVEECIKMMENDSLFNAGIGAVLTNSGTISLDASIMVGSDLSAGAVAGISQVRNPISAARAVMERTKHVMLSGKLADQWAEDIGLEIVDPEYFYTQRRKRSLKRAIEKEKAELPPEKPFKFGTVGAVALDKYGQIVAGTSTGGMTNKKWGRIGDSPVIGAGTYAENSTAGISCTGHGEYFIRYSVAYDVVAQMKYGNRSLEVACADIISNRLKTAGGEGGLIGLDAKGNVVMEFNSAGMYRGWVKPDSSFVGIYR